MNVAAPSLHLLVIEADPADSRPIEQHLHHQGLSASTQRVASWPEIQAALGRGGWDAVLSDYNLPHLDFHDLLALLRDRHPDLPLILVSGRVGEEVAVELLKLGVWDFVLKDNLTRLVPALRRSLQDAADRRVRRLAEAELRGSRLAALNVMEDAVEARQQAEQVSAELRQEIIERQRTETAWRESEQRLRVLGDNLPGGALYQLVVEPGGAARYTYLSAGIERLFGIPADRVLADPQPFWQAILPEDQPRLAAAQAVSARDLTVFDCEFRQRTATGQLKWVHARSSPRRLADGSTAWDGVVADITERKRTEQEIRRLNDTLEQRVVERTAQLELANQELEAFSYSVSHDLRAPLRAIDGFAHILDEDYMARLDQEGQRVLGVICSEAKRMGRLIDDLLAFSRLNRRPLHVAEIDLASLAQAVFDECAAHEPGRHLHFHLEPLPPAHGDPSLLRQVLVNLLSNAIKYTRPKDPAEIRIGGRTEADANLYFVQDNGVGFDMKYVGKLFGVFQRLHAEEEFEGTGVGLALVQRVIHRHGGRVWAEGSLNQGATFSFTLPHPAQPSVP